jgi:outer membrane protein assembly factor BamB
MRLPALLLPLVCAVTLTAADWPGYLGAGHLGDAGPTPALLDNLGTARRLWESADPIPDGRCADISDREHPSICGGFGSPIIHRGRAYLGYYVPAGEVVREAAAARAGGPREKWKTLADDVLHCFDLATGKTVWRTVLPERGLNLNFGNKSGGGITPLAVDGKIYYPGLSGRLHCVDAVTGKVLWTTPIAPRAAHIDLARADALAKAPVLTQDGPREAGVLLPDIGGSFDINRGCLGFPILVGGVVVVPDFVMAAHPDGGKRMPVGGMAGFDPVSGKQLWTVPRCTAGRFQNPMPVTVDGEALVLAVDSYGSTLVQPKDGHVLWRDPAINVGMGLPMVWQDLVAVTAAPGADVAAEAKARLERGASTKGVGKAEWKGFRLARDKATLIWSGRAAAEIPCAVAVRDGIAYPVVASGKGAAVWALDLRSGKGAEGAKPGLAGGEHDNMFSMLIGDRILVSMGGNQGPTGVRRDGVAMLQLGAAGAAPQTLGAPLNSDFAWGYANAIMPAYADGILVYRGNSRLIALDLRRR